MKGPRKNRALQRQCTFFGESVEQGGALYKCIARSRTSLSLSEDYRLKNSVLRIMILTGNYPYLGRLDCLYSH